MDMSCVKNAGIVGDEQLQKISQALPYSIYLSIFSGAISTIKNPYYIELELVNGHKKLLSLAHNKVYSPKETIERAKKAVKMIQKNAGR